MRYVSAKLDKIKHINVELYSHGPFDLGRKFARINLPKIGWITLEMNQVEGLWLCLEAALPSLWSEMSVKEPDAKAMAKALGLRVVTGS